LSEKNFNIPNIISSCRIASVPAMLLCIFFNRESLFTWLLLGALISDILDGVIARAFHLVTRLGAFLDAAADMGTYLSAVAGLFVFKMDFIQGYWPALSVVFAFYVLEKISSFIRYKKIFNAFHTYLSKITAYAQGAFVMSLFLFGFKGYLFYPALVICVLANIEEMALARLLPDYQADVKGLFWVLKEKKKAA
jgi:cardiolipin synthase (CMP-forming)